jgi:hypothetical protein
LSRPKSMQFARGEGVGEVEEDLRGGEGRLAGDEEVMRRERREKESRKESRKERCLLVKRKSAALGQPPSAHNCAHHGQRKEKKVHARKGNSAACPAKRRSRARIRQEREREESESVVRRRASHEPRALTRASKSLATPSSPPSSGCSWMDGASWPTGLAFSKLWWGRTVRRSPHARPPLAAFM